MLDLSDVFKPAPSYSDPFYDMEAKQFTSLNPHNLNAHISSMKHSQMADYKKKLRYVIDETLLRDPGSSAAKEYPHRVENYVVPGLEQALKVCDEVVIRETGASVEFVLKSRDGASGVLRPVASVAASAPATTPGSPSVFVTGKRAPLDL